MAVTVDERYETRRHCDDHQSAHFPNLASAGDRGPRGACVTVATSCAEHATSLPSSSPLPAAPSSRRAAPSQHGGAGDAGEFGGFLDDLGDEFITAADGLAQVATAHVLKVLAHQVGEDGRLAVFHGSLDLAKDGGAAGEGFEAAAIAAAAFGSVDFDDHVADFAGGEVVPAIQIAVDDEPAANARADEDAD